MTDFCNIAIRIKEEDKNKVMKSTTFIDEKVKLDGDWLVVDCGIDDFESLDSNVNEIGSGLIEKFNDYDKALNLILGGNIRYLDKYEVEYDMEDDTYATWDEVKPQVLNSIKEFKKLDTTGLIFFFEDDEWAYTNTNFYEIETVKDAIYKGESDYSLSSKLINAIELADNAEKQMLDTITHVMEYVKKVDFVEDEILANDFSSIKLSNDGNVVLIDKKGFERVIECNGNISLLYSICCYLDSFLNGDFDD